METNQLRTAMLSLIYPAVYGAGLVWLVSGLLQFDSPWSIAAWMKALIALWILIFFAVSYIITSVTPTERYGISPFLLDLAEIVCVFLCFVFLGYVTPGRENLSSVFAVLAAVPLLQSLWNVAVRRQAIWGVSLALSVICISAAYVVHEFAWFIFVAVAGIYGLLIYYVQLKRHKTGW
ncbi:hypothetical protein [Metapseudomonas resinovorans]|uniref:Uncharacterized protein n=1 Tax=Metapseudomonas resinovorans NBRC 106553 TaxID=1245471 RepID=S6AT27_METRE|nr:hypothetical protein [Pseudomonas resinovorans]BAN49248.1 hypothetical protein PCA10_35160 [Pseudomonas resinovorans NBRC 106553]